MITQILTPALQFTSAWALYIFQNGNLYRATVAGGPAGSTVNTSANGLTAASFALVNLATNQLLSGTPDFTSAFTLGFGQRLTVGQSLTSALSFDDLSITLNVAGVAIPEPSSFAMFGLAAVALLAARRKTGR